MKTKTLTFTQKITKVRSVLTLMPLLAAFSFSNALAESEVSPDLEKHWGMIEGYCVDCHNYNDWAGGVSLEGMLPSEVGIEAEVWEEVIRKLSAGMMPPPGQSKPEDKKIHGFIHALENSLDSYAEKSPNPGSVVLHRLNRLEYAAAIEDILGVEVNVEDLLPSDDESEGFTNVAEVLKVSPSFIEQYIAAAREVSEQAIGKPSASPIAKIYPGAPDVRQYLHIDGLPLGTRGGMLVEHHFPTDGEYEFTITGLVGAGYVWGVLDPDKLILTIDDEKVFEQAFGGGEDLKAVDLEQALGVTEINDRFKNIRRFVTAGPHRVGVSYVFKSNAEHHDPLNQFTPVEGVSILVQGTGGGPRIDNLIVKGPYNPQGVSETPSRKKIFSCYPENTAQQTACGKEILANIARKAFRKPIGENDIAGAMSFFERGVEEGSFDLGIQKGVLAILASPKFLYRSHTPPADAAPGEVFVINDLELASRLSFFLWSSPPDSELVELAAANKLSDSEVLNNQVKRMLKDPRAHSLVTSFAYQWFNLENLTQIDPDPDLFPQYTADLVEDFEKEFEMFMASIFDKDAVVHEMLTADYSFLNERLALHYGIKGVRGGQFQKVKLEDTSRWGLLGKGGITMATSYANRTSPVVRGAYVLEKFLGVHAPAPPPNVEAFPETEEGEKALTVRERLEMHRDNPACYSCHAVIDPLGLALENFNAIGQWRDKDRDAGAVIDASGTLVDGSPLSGVNDLREALVKDKSDFAHTFTEKMMTYALGRPVKYFDMPTVRKIVHDAADDDYTISSIVLGIVNSDAFRMDKYEIPEESAVARN